MKTALILTIAGLMALVGLAAFSQDAAVEHGKEVYSAQKCALCHSVGGNGGQKMSLDGVGSKLKPDEIRRWIRTPKEMKSSTTMKPYPNLTPKDLNDLTAYLMTLR